MKNMEHLIKEFGDQQNFLEDAVEKVNAHREAIEKIGDEIYQRNSRLKSSVIEAYEYMMDRHNDFEIDFQNADPYFEISSFNDDLENEFLNADSACNRVMNRTYEQSSAFGELSDHAYHSIHAEEDSDFAKRNFK